MRLAIMLILALAGATDSAYMTWYHYDPGIRVCVVTSGCEAVNSSAYATIGPLPVAVIGVIGYFLIAATIAIRIWGPPGLGRPAEFTAYGLSVLGSGFALYLTGVEIIVLHALCGWCLVSAGVIVALCTLAAMQIAGRAPGASGKMGV
jgi:uncharacterized membrane protein